MLDYMENNAERETIKFDLESHLRKPGTVEFISVGDLLHGKKMEQCVDGRTNANKEETEGVIGTPGGSFAEILLFADTLDVAPEDMGDFMQKYIAASGGTLYWHIDTHALHGLDSEYPWALQAIRETDPYKRNEIVNGYDTSGLVEKLTDPNHHVGCGHVKYMLKDSASYQLDIEKAEACKQRTESLIKIFYTMYFDGARGLEFKVLEGSHHEMSAVDIWQPGELTVNNKVPAIKTALNDAQQTFVHHGQLMEFLREQILNGLMKDDDFKNQYLRQDINEHDLLGKVNKLAGHRLGVTLEKLSPDKPLPVFTVIIKGDTMESLSVEVN